MRVRRNGTCECGVAPCAVSLTDVMSIVPARRARGPRAARAAPTEEPGRAAPRLRAMRRVRARPPRVARSGPLVADDPMAGAAPRAQFSTATSSTYSAGASRPTRPECCSPPRWQSRFVSGCERRASQAASAAKETLHAQTDAARGRRRCRHIDRRGRIQRRRQERRAQTRRRRLCRRAHGRLQR